MISQPTGAAAADDGAELLELLRRDGAVRTAEAMLTPLGGGVSSEIYRVDDGERRFVVKRALRQLKVRDAWFADPRRNLHEQAYLRYAAGILPTAVPALLYASRAHCYFTMEYLGEGFINWKQELLAGRCDVAHARMAATILAAVHRRSRGDGELAAEFDTTDDFIQLRIEPYLLTTGARHPSLEPHFKAEAKRLAATREALVHGDFSPKNLLINGERMVVLDCEAAWYGDPAFDVAFLLNHLLLKSLHHAGRDVGLRAAAEAAWQTYRAAHSDESITGAIGQRTAPLLLMLLLARVDGKSPVEYLDASKQQFVRDYVHHHLPNPPRGVVELMAIWFEALPHGSKG